MLTTLVQDRPLRMLLGAASLVVIVAGLRSLASVLDPLLLAGVVVACAAPLQQRLRRRGVGRGLSMALVALTVVFALVAFAVLLGYAGRALVVTVPQYQDRLAALVASGATWLDAHGIEASQSELVKLVNPARAIGIASSVAQSLAGAVSVTLLIVLLSILLLIETSAFWRRAERAGRGATLSNRWERRLNAIAADVQQYVWITFITGAMFAAAVWVVMLLLGVDLAALWAILALVLSFVPGIGFVFSMIPPAMLALLEFGPGRGIVVIVLFILFNSVVDNVIKPRFMKEGFDLGPFVMFTAILFWAFVLGPTGGLLAIPLTTAVRRLFFTPDEEEAAEPDVVVAVAVAP